MKDLEILKAIEKEADRQLYNIELIASENYVSSNVLEAAGSILTNKYAEGYPGKRYYGGCENVDVVESLAIQRLKEIYGCEHANVQPHSGSQANMAVYFSVLNPGDTVLGMDLSNGGHLTHGSPVNFSGKLFNFVFYGVDKVGAAISEVPIQTTTDDLINKINKLDMSMLFISDFLLTLGRYFRRTRLNMYPAPRFHR